jgi:N utilization substance protein B
MSKRSELRESAAMALYQMELIEIDKETAIENVCDISNKFLEELIDGVSKYKDDLDVYIENNLTNWKLDRLAILDKQILRVATFELVYTDTPDIVCINEAIELAKKYSDDNMPKVVNGVLDAIAMKKENGSL